MLQLELSEIKIIGKPQILLTSNYSDRQSSQRPLSGHLAICFNHRRTPSTFPHSGTFFKERKAAAIGVKHPQSAPLWYTDLYIKLKATPIPSRTTIYIHTLSNFVASVNSVYLCKQGDSVSRS